MIVMPWRGLGLGSGYLVSGAGSAEWNGLYTYGGESESLPYYQKDGAHFLYGDAGGELAYVLGTDIPAMMGYPGTKAYKNDDLTFPHLGTWTTLAGTAPAPTVTQV